MYTLNSAPLHQGLLASVSQGSSLSWPIEQGFPGNVLPQNTRLITLNLIAGNAYVKDATNDNVVYRLNTTNRPFLAIEVSGIRQFYNLLVETTGGTTLIKAAWE